MDFSGQHDARVLPDGTISVLDNGTNANRPPRVLRFQIDPQNRTATLIQTLTDPTVTSSFCCGSARLLPTGDWVVDWGGTPTTDELAPDGSLVLRLNLEAPYFSYRTVPIMSGELALSDLIAGMDAMYPRTSAAGGDAGTPPSGASPWALVKSLRIAPFRFEVIGRSVGGKCVPLARANRKDPICTRHLLLRVTFNLNQTTSVKFAVRRIASGRMAGGGCHPATRANHNRRRCDLLVSVGRSFKLRGAAGLNRFLLTGQLGRATLMPGSYSLTAAPTDGQGSGATRTMN